ncbi:NERD domain-containing protein [Bacillus sp. H-16]|uniref:NERD domain-containing protein n=1 Tax=Alteribacter salitolerans TaxID=2912333 RepID=UPI00196267D8|nr:NERD domain-containing protein [Alteribacter salitolerans]
MSIIDSMLYRVMNGKRTITKPIFMKEFTKENNQLTTLTSLASSPDHHSEWLNRDIAFLKQGIEGEANVYYELKNSFLPMVCLHDIRLEHADYIAQFDFIVITRKEIIVLETKKLTGDITITPDGDFIRLFKNKYGKVYKKEGIYSPVSQNERHVAILKEVLMSKKLIGNMPVKSAVIMANAKTILDKSKAPKHVSNQIYKYDQVKNLIKKELDNPSNNRDTLEKYLYEIGEFLLAHNKPLEMNAASKYAIREVAATETPVVKTSHLSLEANLKEYRLKTARKEGIKAYMVFSNSEMKALIEKPPATKDELLEVKGFGQKKVEKYGEGILAVISNDFM